MTAGVAAWIIQRVSAVVLLFGVPLKVVSGWATTGEVSWGSWLAGLHTNAAIDVAVVGAVAFHALFGIRVLLIDSGHVDAAQRLTLPFGVVGVGITGWTMAVLLA